MEKNQIKLDDDASRYSVTFERERFNWLDFLTRRFKD